MLESVQYESAGERASRVIKRYSNRKLYDTRSSRYVTLLQIADMVRAGDDVQIVDNRTKEDKTEVTLALIISEELKSSPGGIPLTTLRALIRHDSMLPMSGTYSARGDGGSGPPASGAYSKSGSGADGSRSDRKSRGSRSARGQNPISRSFAQWRESIEHRMRNLANSRDLEQLDRQIEALGERLAELERRVETK